MIIDCVSDLHGCCPKLDGGDLLLLAGDYTARDSILGWDMFYDWLSLRDYRKKVLVGGNHDGMLYTGKRGIPKHCDAVYLCDSGIEFDGVKIWGSPWTKTFSGINPNCAAFTLKTDGLLARKWALIPDDTQILITHCPPFGVGDGVDKFTIDKRGQQKSSHRLLGSRSLAERLRSLKSLKLHVFGHVHDGYGKYYAACVAESLNGPIIQTLGPVYVNASHMNEEYEPVNAPIRVEL